MRKVGSFCASAIASLAATALASCVHVPPRERAAFRLDEYFESHREVAPSIAQAMRNGHVVGGMDRQQVLAVLGEPMRRFRSRSPSAFEVWLYPAHKVHQGYAHGATLCRVVFREERLLLIEPI